MRVSRAGAGWLRLRHWILLAALGGAGAMALAGAVTSADTPAASTDMADLVGRLLPTVVSISTSRAVERMDSNQTQAGLSAPNLRRVNGSGFIIDASGLIVTNKHVVQDASHLTVTLQDNATYRAIVVGQGIETDIALLKIEPLRSLPVAVFGDSDKMRPGDHVVAIGNPLGLGGSVSGGIVSAVNRDIGGDSPFGDFIQTDAAINHGNSGGPLFNGAGEVIGMNTALFSPNPAGGSVGLGFAIPSNDVSFVIGQLRKYGRVHAGWIGIRLQPLTPGLIDAAGLTEAATAIVADVDPESPAAEAGLQAGDIVIRVANSTVQDVSSFMLAVAAKEPGTRCKLIVWRAGHELPLEMTVREWPSMRGAAPSGETPAVVNMSVPQFGLALAPLSDEDRTRYAQSNFKDGVAVRDIDPASAAATTELSVGDIIRNVQHNTVSAPDEVIGLLSKARNAGAQNAMMLIEGPGGLRWMSLPLAN